MAAKKGKDLFSFVLLKINYLDVVTFYAGYEEIVEYLINKKADVKYSDENGWTPLHHLAQKGSCIVLRFFQQFVYLQEEALFKKLIFGK